VPTKPKLVDEVVMTGYPAWWLSVANKTAYVASGKALSVLDLTSCLP